MSESARQRPGLALTALAAILVITAAWWALALWPLAPAAPQWLLTTRAVCFGATADSLPHAGGWLLLIGEPIGMLAALMIVWGRELRRDFAQLHTRALGRLVTTAVVVACVVGVAATARRVAAATGASGGEPFAVSTPLGERRHDAPPPLALIDQQGRRTTLDAFRGRWLIVTFAFGHCDAICPLIVHDVLRARVDEGTPHVPLAVVTLDPWRDTPDRLAAIAAAWGLGTDDRMLSGTIEEVNETLDAWGVPRTRNPDTGEITHPGVIVVLDPAGRVAWRIEGATHRVREALERSRREAVL